MLTVTVAELRHHRRRMVALLAAIMISVGFVVACLTFVQTQERVQRNGVAAGTANADAVVEYEGDARAGAVADRLEDVAGVAAVDPVYTEHVPYVGPGGVGDLDLTSIPTTDALRTATLVAGRWPTGPDEVALPRTTADRAGVGVGGTLTVDRSGQDHPTTLTVTGLSRQTGSLFTDLSDTGLAAATHFAGRASTDWTGLFLVRGEPPVDDAALVSALDASLGSTGSAQPQAAYAAAQLEGLTRDADVFGSLLLVFGAIALLVSSVIIANTLSVLVTQRRRQIGLLRAAGATRRQVRRGVVAEAAVLGLVGSLLGVVLGVGIALLAGVVTGSAAADLSVPWPRVGGAVAAGVVMTVLAGLVPARRASRVAPIEALREASADDPLRRGSRVRLVVVATLALLGTGLAGFALHASSQQVAIAVAGAGLLSVAVVVGTPYYLPVLLRGLGRLAGVVGPTGRLAAANASRNPGRAAATCVALMLAVGLVVTIQVGTASTRRTTAARIAESYPVDLTVSRTDATLGHQVVTGVDAVPGVAATVPVRVATARVLTPKPAPGEAPSELAVKALGSGADRVVQAGLGVLTDATVLVSYDGAQGWGLTGGEQVTLGRGRHRVRLTVLISRVPDAGSAVVSTATLDRLDADAPVQEVWAEVADRGDAGDVLSAVRRVAALQSGTQVGGALPQSAELDQVLDVLVTVATALLGVAVLIAVIGVGNTLGLSVLERTRESALLRALGLQRRQLQQTLVVEAVLLSLVATVVGVVVGIGFGWLGTSAVSLQSDLHRAQLVVPVGPTLAVVVVALVAGALAALVPAHRAAQAVPTAALADA